MAMKENSSIRLLRKPSKDTQRSRREFHIPSTHHPRKKRMLFSRSSAKESTHSQRSSSKRRQQRGPSLYQRV